MGEKYNRNDIVEATYENDTQITRNPFIEAMPKLMNVNEFKERIASFPPVPYNLLEMSKEIRREQLALLNQVFIPMDFMYEVYDFLYRGIKLNYKSKSTTDYIRQMHKLYYNILDENTSRDYYSTQSFSGALLGVPGIGKTSTIRRSLNLIPQLIIHKNYYGDMFYCKQITYLIVECPHDCSVKTLAFSIISEIDKVSGSDYLNELSKKYTVSASTLAVKIKIICLNHHVGIIIIDEIQNAIQTAYQNKQVKSLIKFLVELSNEAYVSLCFSGTLEADNLFRQEEHLLRRTEGFRLLPMKPNKTFYDFLRYIWPYQMTAKKAEFNEKIANRIYDYSKGIPSHIIKIFEQTQVQAILSGKEVIDESIVKRTISKYSIMAYSSFEDGTSISDFCFEPTINGDINAKTKKGRPVVKRDSHDLIMMQKSIPDQKNFISALEQKKLLICLGE